jgi:probable phosphoglycerate mutase
MLQFLVRHGESVSNLEGRVQGQEDVELSPLGREQARRVADWARTLAASTGISQIRFDEQLRELHAGIFQGHLWADLERTFPDEVARWRSGDVDYVIPGGESRAQLAARGRVVLEALAARETPGMIVVAHGGILTAALGSMLGRQHPLLAAAAERPFTKLPALANCSVTQLAWPGPRLVAFNDTAHLGD